MLGMEFRAICVRFEIVDFSPHPDDCVLQFASDVDGTVNPDGIDGSACAEYSSTNVPF